MLLHLLKSFVLYSLNSSFLLDINQKRPPIPRKKYGADAAISEYKTQIVSIARQVMVFLTRKI